MKKRLDKKPLYFAFLVASAGLSGLMTLAIAAYGLLASVIVMALAFMLWETYGLRLELRQLKTQLEALHAQGELKLVLERKLLENAQAQLELTKQVYRECDVTESDLMAGD